MASKSVQCVGADNLLTYYDKRGVEAWSVFEGTQFLAKGMGSEMLQEFLEFLEDSNSYACYTLKVYEDIKESKEIKSTSRHDGSINFKLFEGYQKTGNVNSNIGGQGRTMNQVSQIVEQRIAEKISGYIDAEDKPHDKSDTIGDILQNPELLKQYIEAFSMIAGIFRPAQLQQPRLQPAFVGNVTRIVEPETTQSSNTFSPAPTVTQQPQAAQPTPQTETAAQEYTEEMQLRLVTVLNELEKADPKILIHLEQLNEIAKTNRPFFNIIIAQLDNMMKK